LERLTWDRARRCVGHHKKALLSRTSTFSVPLPYFRDVAAPA
jgi:hypothetical protein